MRERHVILLAGGGGRRVQSLTRSPDGRDVPKQFCRLRDGRSLLDLAIARARSITDDSHIVPVVFGRHREWWTRDLPPLARGNAIVQAENRGTATAIRLAVGRILAHSPDASLVVMPSDHFVDDEFTLRITIMQALDGVERGSGSIVLLGMTPAEPDADLGWIVPSRAGANGLARVAAFAEKPAPERVTRLFGIGALVNTFIFAADAWALRALIDRHLPELARSSLRQAPTLEFSADLLERAAAELHVMRVPPCGWTDLGTPARLSRWLDRHDEAFTWSGFERQPAGAMDVHAGGLREDAASFAATGRTA